MEIRDVQGIFKGKHILFPCGYSKSYSYCAPALDQAYHVSGIEGFSWVSRLKVGKSVL